MTAKTDFIDEDLVVTKTDTSKKTTPARKTPPRKKRENNVPTKELTLTRLTRHREQIEGQVAATISDIERLRRKQEDLERDRKELESIRRKQDEYEKSKHHMIQQLKQSLLALEKEEVKASQMAELSATTRQSFQEMLHGLGKIDEAKWSEEDMKNELERAQLMIDSVRVDCSKAMAKIEAVAEEGKTERVSLSKQDSGKNQPEDWPGFSYWLTVGGAIGIFLFVALLFAGLLHFYLTKIVFP